MLGSYHINDYTKKAAVAMFLFFAFFVILLMLNLLIAIMGESSCGRCSHFHAALFVLSGESLMEDTRTHANDITAHG
jgi:hypothetical protein